MNLTQVDYRRAGGIATITLQRPKQRNAFTAVMADELVRAAAEADDDDDVRVVVVTGAGTSFCVGADLSTGATTFGRRRTEDRPPGPLSGRIAGVPRDRGGVVSLAFAALRKPVIAALNGTAVGVGLTMTLAMDIRIAADSARFGFPFVRRGIVPEAASTWYLPRIVGISQAIEWVASGRIFDAAEALHGGLVSRVLPAEQVVPVAMQLGQEIADNTSGIAVAASRQLLWSMLGAPSPWDAHRLESRALDALGPGPDAAEGITSFLEKRQPQFRAPLGPDEVVGLPRWPSLPEDVTADRPHG